MSLKHHTHGEDYVLARGVRESLRVHAQYFLINQTLGYALHPLISPSDLSDPPNVLDVGTGNACWLLDVANQFSTHAKLVGLDVSDAHFPAKHHLPENLKLKVLDVFENVPAELVGAFDIVHIRALAIVVPDGNPGRLVGNLVKMMRPRGYLQWDEADLATWGTRVPNGTIQAVNAEEAFRILHEHLADSGLDFKWVSNLGQILADNSLEVLTDQTYTIPPKWYKLATDNWTVCIDDIAQLAINRGRSSFGKDKEWDELYREMLVEVEGGVNLAMDFAACLARKKMNKGA